MTEMKFDGGYTQGDAKYHRPHGGRCYEQERKPVCPSHNVLQGQVYLPHSCNEWVIGGSEQVRMMIDDLTKLLGEMEVGNG